MSEQISQEEINANSYQQYLSLVGSFSKLFSSSDIPFIQYRVAENVFCKSFKADNLARADVAYDAIIDKKGIGIKTFILKGNSKVEKVAEFNAYSQELHKLDNLDLAKKLAHYRNERIKFADRTYDVETRIYHIVGRDINELKIFEESYDLIDVESLKIITQSKSSLKFKDARNEYNFNFSKSVLMKRFVVPDDYISVQVDILENPLEVLLKLSKNEFRLKENTTNPVLEPVQKTSDLIIESEDIIPGVNYVILPLYSPNRKANYNLPIVPERSQLNQWNAGGRKRDPGEVYISIPKEIHHFAPDFFPDRDTIFNLKVPDGEILEAKVCQEGNKALMTNPNNAMAGWLLRKVLQLKEGELLTYEKLKDVGSDSVKITKIDKSNYLIDFEELNSYENFIDPIN